jgi:hypothetical protein
VCSIAWPAVRLEFAKNSGVMLTFYRYRIRTECPRVRVSLDVEVSNSPVSPDPFQRPGQDLWRKTISQIPTHFGRLRYLASLRDAHTGKYTHQSLNSALGADDADRLLCHAHHKVFSEWLCFSLAEQKADLDDFLSSPQRQISFQECRDLVPAGAREVERQLFVTDLEMVLELMRLALDGVSGTPGT